MDGHSAVLDARPASAAEPAAWRPAAVPHPLAGFDLTSRMALVTGARRGIGLAIATALTAQGASVVVHHADGSEEAEDAAEVLADIQTLAGRGTTLAADFSQTGAGTRLAQGAPAITRRLLAAVHADIVGFSRLVEQDDLGTLARLQLLRKELVVPLLHHHGGHLVNAAGDALLLVFESVTNAVTFALDMQAGIRCNEKARSEASRIRYRIGIHIGDVIMSDGDVCGNGVNIASRLQACCPPDGVCVSRAVLDIVQARLLLAFAPLGVKTFRNISAPVETFALGKEAGKNPDQVDSSTNSPDAPCFVRCLSCGSADAVSALPLTSIARLRCPSSPPTSVRSAS